MYFNRNPLRTVGYIPESQELDFDTGAFLYYATIGAVDPKAPVVDAPAVMAAQKGTYARALGTVVFVGALAWGIGGYIVDPFDKREGGLWESPIIQSAWIPIKQGWEMGRESDQPWWL